MSANVKPRQWKAEGFFPFRVEILTPIYIGSGETLSPLEYVVRQDKDTYKVWLVDVGAWLQDHAHDASVQSILATDSVNRIRRMFQDRIDAQEYGLCASHMDSVFAKNLMGNISKDSGKALEIDAQLRNPLNKSLLLPGSSLKGALSTPIIDWQDGLLAKLKLPQRPTLRDKYRQGLENMFGKIDNHAMQALKVADVNIPASCCHVMQAKECSYKEKKSYTPKNACETIFTQQPLYVSLFMDSRTGAPAIDLQEHGGPVISLDILREKCNAFYKKRFDDEMQKFYVQPHLSHIRQGIAAVKQRMEHALAQNIPPILLRVGHYSHVECVTVQNNEPQARKGYGKTRTLANGKIPFGWLLLHPCSLEEYTQGVQHIEACIQQEYEAAVYVRQARKAEKMAQQQARLEAQQAKERAAQEAKKAEEARLAAEAAEQERLATLSAEERCIAELALPTATEDTAQKLLATLESWDVHLQYQAALALKAYWEKLQKWSGKKLTDKQKKKVQRVQALLERGEKNI